MALDSEVNRMELIMGFPNLRNDPYFHIKSEETDTYNCIAWAMGTSERWVSPKANTPGYWWPDGVDMDTKKESLIAAFKAVGFSMANDNKIEEGYDKVVLFAKGDDWKHAARIIDDEVEYSKFGQGWDATHGHNVLSGASYGYEYAYMKRPIESRHLTEDAFAAPGSIEATVEKLDWRNM